MPKIKERLFCSFCDDEVEQKGQELSTASITYDEVEDAKKSAMKEYTDNLKALRGTMRTLSKAIRSKGEVRDVECVVRMDKPQIGSKQTVRLDTGEIVRTEPMTDEEKQQELFPEDELAELDKMFGKEAGKTEAEGDESK
jgi:hypothetical protein